MYVPLPTVYATGHLPTSLPESRALQLFLGQHRGCPALCMPSPLPHAQEKDCEQNWTGYSHWPAVPLGSVSMCHLCRVGMAIRASQSKQWQGPGLPGPQSRRRRGIEAAERMGSAGIWSRGESPEQGPGPRSIQKEQSAQKRRGWPSLLSLSCSLDGYAVHVDGESLPVGTKRGLLGDCEAHGVTEVGPG